MSQVVQSEVVREFVKSKEESFFKNKEDTIKELLISLRHMPSNFKDRFSLFFISLFTMLNISGGILYFGNQIPNDSLIYFFAMMNSFAIILTFAFDWCNRHEFCQTLHKIKKLLESTHYETRIKYVSFFSSTLKIVVEGNIDNNGLIIKESSKHFTSYMDTTDKVELVKNLVKIIEKQEKMFKVKE